MKSREHRHPRLDVLAFAREGATLAGRWPVSDLHRLQASRHASAPASAAPEVVTWSVRGEFRAVAGGASQVWLHIQAQTALPLECQRCLGPVCAEVQVDRAFRFVADEATAIAEDVEAEEDLLVLTRHLDLAELVEDELLLALPLVPRHDVCPNPLPSTSLSADDSVEDADVPPHPFAALAGFKARGGGTAGGQ